MDDTSRVEIETLAAREAVASKRYDDAKMKNNLYGLSEQERIKQTQEYSLAEAECLRTRRLLRQAIRQYVAAALPAGTIQPDVVMAAWNLALDAAAKTCDSDAAKKIRALKR